jgi:hypothetical protein
MNKWSPRPILAGGFDPLGLPNGGSVDFTLPGLDLDHQPSVAEALAVRTDRARRFRDYLATVTATDLDRPVEVLENGTNPLRECLSTVFEEEFWPNRYVRRDPARPGSPPAGRQATGASQRRPIPARRPNPLASHAYAEDFRQVTALGRVDSTVRTAAQTSQALFWTDHDIRQWNDGLIRLAVARGFDLVQTARMLAMAHTAGGDAMIACFDAKYHYWFWRPYQAIPQAGTDGNPTTAADATWQPLRATPNFPEYPSAHACHSTAMVTALDAFFGTDKIAFSLDSTVTGTTRQYARFSDVVPDVDLARVLVGFHFWTSDLRGSMLGRKVGTYTTQHYFQAVH